MAEYEGNIGESVPVEEGSAIHLLKVSGKIYSSQSDLLEKRIMDGIAAGAERLVIDCSELVQIDSSALSAVIAGLRRIKGERNGRIVFAGMSDQLKRMISITKLDKYIPNFPSVAPAIKP